MKTVKLITTIVLAVFTLAAFSQTPGKVVSHKTHIKFFSTTPVEDIEANNYKAVSTLNKTTGDVIFSVPMQGFEFKKSMMQKHYNGAGVLDTKQFPKSKFKGKITNITDVDFTKNGTYQITVTGTMTIKGVTKNISEKGSITVKDGAITVNCKFDLTLADYGISFAKGKMQSNVAKTVLVTLVAEY